MPEETTQIKPEETTQTPPVETTQDTQTSQQPQVHDNQQPVQPAQSTEVEGKTEETPKAPEVNEASIIERVSKGVIDKIGDALGLTKKEVEEQIPTDPKELAKYVEGKTQKTVEQVLADREKKEQEVKAEQERTQSEGAKHFQSLWTRQYSELAETGRVPKITNATDKNDPGNLVKIKILTKLKEILDNNQAQGIDYVPTLKEVFYENPDILRNETTTGANTPVAGNTRVQNNSQGLTRDQIRNASFEDLVASKYSN